MLIEYVHPSHMPSIDDAKSPQVTPEVSNAYINYKFLSGFAQLHMFVHQG